MASTGTQGESLARLRTQLLTWLGLNPPRRAKTAWLMPVDRRLAEPWGTQARRGA
jgi:hypothetical protein